MEMKKMKKAKGPSEASMYLQKQYARVLTPDPSGVYVAQILEFPGCVAEGNTPQEAYERLEAAAESWVAAILADGQAIPEPTYDKIRDFNGKVALRLPRSLHRDAVRFAQRESTSLNQFLVSSISSAVGAMNLYEHVARKIDRRVVQYSLLRVSAVASDPKTTMFASQPVTTFEGETQWKM